MKLQCVKVHRPLHLLESEISLSLSMVYPIQEYILIVQSDSERMSLQKPPLRNQVRVICSLAHPLAQRLGTAQTSTSVIQAR